MVKRTLLVLMALVPAAPASAQTLAQLLARYEVDAKVETPTFKAFSAARGRTFYATRHAVNGSELACATCHTDNPMALGRTRVGKEIKPLAPAANQERFTDNAKVEKWFRRNCDDVLSRPCTAIEKGDFITYLRSVQ